MDKEALRSYRSLGREIEQIHELIIRIEVSLVEAKTPKLSDMPISGGKTQDQILNNIALLETLHQMYNAKRDELLLRQFMIETAIDGLTPTERTLMRYRYVEGLTWDDVAERMNYSIRAIHNIHGVALQRLHTIA